MENLRVTVEEQLQQLQALMHRAAFYSHVEKYNPHRGQGRVLALLKMKPEITQKELTFLLNMSKQSLAELIGKLEKRGLITREPSEADKRVMMIKLTEQGVQEADNVASPSSDTLEALDCLNDEELATFNEYLGRIIAYYEEQFPDEDFEQRRQSMEEFMRHHGPRGGGRGHHHGHGHKGKGHGHHCEGQGHHHGRGHRSECHSHHQGQGCRGYEPPFGQMRTLYSPSASNF